METKLLDYSDIDKIGNLFDLPKQMGIDSSKFDLITKNGFSNLTKETFTNTFLSGLEHYRAFGTFEDDRLISFIATYDSIDNAEWYFTQVRSVNKIGVQHSLDLAIAYYESKNKFRFYSVFNLDYDKVFRRFAFSKYNNERYDSVNEFIVPAKTRCIYSNVWQILFNRTLVPVDTIVRLTYLKPEFRPELGIAGNI